MTQVPPGVPRAMPQPIPAIHPLPEYLAEGETKARYEDMKTVLQVPWMGVVTMAYAHYPNFFDALWAGLRPICGSTAYIEGARDLRARVENGVVALKPPPLAGRLGQMGYAPRELGQIRAMIEVFSHGNFLYLTIAAMTAWLLHGGEMSGVREAAPFAGRHAPEADVPFVLMEAHHVDPPTQALYEDIKATLGLPFVNTDYRALARWPSYFAAAWGDLRSHPGTPAHEAIALSAHEGALTLARTLPNPAGLTAASLCEAAAKDAPLEEIQSVARLFFYLLPGLVTNVAFFRQQLAT
ncbi:MAG: halocarboxylic acid dehydrogenase DehI family protein [Alphaproteobacteria bacterium]|nr:halocarboxylic acid dehydrogenase DehI family protein [Alphaproteobacteria bacterium]